MHGIIYDHEINDRNFIEAPVGRHTHWVESLILLFKFMYTILVAEFSQGPVTSLVARPGREEGAMRIEPVRSEPVRTQ